jgi:uncharacterized protein YndB with AHSA1/START domain
LHIEEVRMAGEQVTRETVLPIDTDDAWELVATEDGLRQWLAPDVELDADEGGDLRVELEDGSRRVGVVERVDPRRELVFRWRADEPAAVDSEVSIVLVPLVAGTRVVVVERLGAAAPQAAVAGAWGVRLAALHTARAGLVPA